MKPQATQILKVVKTTARVALKRDETRRVGGQGSVRSLTLPPGTAQSYPRREYNILEGYTSDFDEDRLQEYDSQRARVQTAMSPRVRMYGTSSFDAPDLSNGTLFSPLRHIPTVTGEDYDEWNGPDRPEPTAIQDLGQPSDYDPTIQALLHTSTLGETMAEYASPFETVDFEGDIEIFEENQFLHNGEESKENDQGVDDVSLGY